MHTPSVFASPYQPPALMPAANVTDRKEGGVGLTVVEHFELLDTGSR